MGLVDENENQASGDNVEGMKLILRVGN